MANIPIYDGSPTFTSGSMTPFGFYDGDSDFQTDSVKVSKFCANRLGYPLVDVELQSGSFFTAFEEAVTTYGNELYAYKVRQDYLSLEGASTGSNLNHALIEPNMATIVRISEQYGEEAGVGGSVEWYTGSVVLTASRQTYDLNAWAATQGIGSRDIEIKEVFFQQVPAITRFFDPYAGTGTGVQSLMTTFGWGSYSPAISFMLMPVYYDLETIQAIQFNDTIRKSNYSFELINDKLRVFPLPGTGDTGRNLWFKYILKSDRNNPIMPSGSNKITNVSNVPYTNPNYDQINSIGRQWIFEYTLALSKEMLGYVRGKYGTVPIPGAEVTMNQADLISAATAEKTSLVDRLRAYFDETSRTALLERRAQEGTFKKDELGNSPMTIFIG